MASAMSSLANTGTFASNFATSTALTKIPKKSENVDGSDVKISTQLTQLVVDFQIDQVRIFKTKLVPSSC
jgi:hypothetical protein